MTTKPDFANLLVGIPIAGLLLLFFWVRGIELREDAVLATYLIGLGVFISTATLAKMEAKAHAITADKAGEFGSTAWFFMIALFWAVSYPWYMHRRGEFGLRAHFGAAIALAALFIFTLTVIQAEIQQMKG